MPDEFKTYCETWKKHHPTWEYKLWTEDNLPDLRYKHLINDDILHPSYIAEIVRLEVVLMYGGIWVDTDFECFKPIDPLMGDVEAFSAYQYPDTDKIAAIACGIFGCIPKHPWMQELVDRLTEWWKPDRMSLGPWYFTPITRKHPEVKIFERYLLYPYGSWEKGKRNDSFPDAYAAHHWAGTWVKAHGETMAKEAAKRESDKRALDK